MGTLDPKVDLLRGETLTSFVSRLAKVNWMTLTEFCRTVGMRLQGVVDAGSDALDALTEMVDLPRDMLVTSAIVRNVDGLFVRGERVTRHDVRRERLCFCPDCLCEDVARGGDAEPYGRLPWSLSAILTCPDHSLSLCEVGPLRTTMTHDFAGRVGPLLKHLDAAREVATRRASSSFETYLLRRLESGPGQSPWLDGLPWHVVAKTCEIIGAMETLGRSPNLKILTGHERFEAAAVGFEIVRGGKAGIRNFLESLERSFVHGKTCKAGPQAVLGRLWHFLAFSSPDIGFDPLRDIVRDFVVDEFPVDSGALVLGREVAERRVHSVCSASLETGVDRRRLRKLMVASGILTVPEGTPDALATFDRHLADDFLTTLREAIPTSGLPSYLKASVTQVAGLVNAGLIEPFSRPDAELHLKEALYSRSELDGFLAALSSDVSEDLTVASYPSSVARSAKLAGCTSAEVIGLLVKRRLRWVGRKGDHEGVASLLVDAVEVRSLVDRIPEQILSCWTAERMLDLSLSEMRLLIQTENMPTLSIETPGLGKLQVMLIASHLYRIADERINYIKSQRTIKAKKFLYSAAPSLRWYEHQQEHEKV